MLTASRALMAPDPLLPERDRLMDTAEFGLRIASALGSSVPLAVERCERIKAKYRIGESLRVLHRIRVDGVWHVVAARMFASGRAQDAHRKAREAAVFAGPLRPVGFDPSIDTVFWAFPNDRKIANLSVLARPIPVGNPALDGHWISSRMVAYAPERAATAQCLGPDQEVLGYAKVYAGEDGARSQQIHDQLHRAIAEAGLGLRLPAALAYAPQHRVLLVEPVIGRQFDAIRCGELPTAFRALGVALAQLHGLPALDAPRYVRLDPSRLEQAARLIARVRPDVGESAARLTAMLVDQWNATREGTVPLHGDVNSRNWLLQDGSVALIDLDQMSLGPAAADLGGALAGLRYRTCAGAMGAGEEAVLRRALLGGYASVRPLPSNRALRWNTAAALLVERALRAVTRFRYQGLLHLEALLTEAMLVLEGSIHE